MASKIINIADYVGKIYGQLTIIDKVAPDNHGHTRFLCKCSCDKFTNVLKYNLDSGYTTSCGCFRKSSISKRTKKDLTSRIFGRLTVICEAGRSNRREVLWKCLCSCGNENIVKSIYLINGDVTSCGCRLKDMVGENSPHWQGGISLKGYCSVWRDLAYKKSIKIRDNNICQNPYCYKTDNILNIHHIDYDKKNCHPSNLITICRTCNTRANKFREWHTEWYQTIMNKKFGYTY